MRIPHRQVLAKRAPSAIALLIVLLLLQSPLSAIGQTTQGNSLEEAKRLNDEVEKLYAAGRYDEALTYAERALTFQENVLGAEHLLTSTALNNLGELYRIKGNYDKAESLCVRALAIREKLLGEQPGTAIVLNNLALIYTDRGDYEKAEPLFTRVLKVYEKTFGAEHPATVNSLTNLAVLQHQAGDYAKAEPLLLRALALNEKVVGAEHPSVALVLDCLAIIYQARGDYTKAEPLFLRALAIFEKRFGDGNPNTAQLINNLGALYVSKGDYEKAELLYTRALPILEKTLGDGHPATANTLNNLGTVYRAKRDYAKAETFFIRALAIQEKALGENHPDVARSLNNLAELYKEKGDYAKAEPLFLRALAIYESVRGALHPDMALALNNLALLYHARGDYARAEPFYLRSLAIFEKLYGDGNPQLTLPLTNLAWLYQATGRLAQAVSLLSRSNAVSERDFARNLAAGSERQRLLYLQQTSASVDLTLSLHTQFAPDDLAARQMALTVLLQRKGRALDATTDAVAALRRHASAEDQKLLDQLIAARSHLSNATLKGPGREGVAKHQEELKTLEEAVEKLEADLSRRSAEFRAQALPVTLAAVQSAIPADTVLVEFATFRTYDPKSDKYGGSRYVAYLLNHAGEIQWADLGDTAGIDKAVKEFRAVLHAKSDHRLSDLNAEVIPKARYLDERVMRPVRALVGDKKRLLISPDGSLNLLPFDALVDEKNHYLVEGYSISYLTSGRDLLRLQIPRQSRQATLIVADPDFDSGEKTTATSSADERIAKRVTPSETDQERIAGRVTARPGPKLGDVQLAPLGQLPGSAVEGAELKKLLPTATLWTGGQATESALKHVSSPVILHISTHGGFLEDAPLPEPSKQQGLMMRPAGTGRADDSLPPKVQAVNPLLRSGLFFAGANTERSGDDDGVLTALEAAGLDLYGTKLVVLSACDTGVGEVKNGDGVYGLRRAFVLAGAETQVMSLWPVSDEGTSELMVDYYKRLLAGEGRGEALRQVRLKMLASKDRKHPYYWASFIQSGEWANLDGKR